MGATPKFLGGPNLRPTFHHALQTIYMPTIYSLSDL